MTNQHSYFRNAVAALILASILVSLAPSDALAASSSSKKVVSATISSPTLSFISKDTVVIHGTADNTSKIRFTITDSKNKEVAKSSTTKVRDDAWQGSLSKSAAKKLKNGSYTVSVYDASSHASKKALARSAMTIGAPTSVLRASSIPLLSGGTAQRGSTIPISYLQVSNQSDQTVAINGFWIQQNGTAGDSSVTGFSSVDDKGEARTSTMGNAPVKNRIAYIPSTAALAPHQTKLFTLKAQLANNAVLGSSVMIDVTGIDAPTTFTNTFPIRGTTWTVGL